MKKISERQRQILSFIESFTAEHGYAPSVREIGAAVHLRSPSTVHSHLKTLSQAGLIRKDERKTRAATPLCDANCVPIIGAVTAGQPIFAREEMLGTLNYRVADSRDYFALKVQGDSMINAGILDGDYVVVHRQNTAQSGQIIVALLGEEATVKRLRLSAREVWLMPENEAYDPIDGTRCAILGLVTAVVRELD